MANYTLSTLAMSKRKSSIYSILPRLSYAKAEYPGRVENLVVTLSRHYYLSPSGLIKYQKKKIEFPIQKLINGQLPDKDLLVHFALKDDHSSLCHVETYPISKLSSIESFLFRAWRKKKATLFHGYPDILVPTQTTLDLFPEIFALSLNLGIMLGKPESGFRTGIELIKLWESNFETTFHLVSVSNVEDFLFSLPPVTFPNYIPYLFLMNRSINDGSETLQRDLRWQNGIKCRPRDFELPPDNFEEFCSLFIPSEADHLFDTYTYDFFLDLSERDKDLQIKPTTDVKEEALRIKQLHNEIKSRPGFRYVKMVNGSYHVVYNAAESSRYKHSAQRPWLIECEEHKTVNRTRTVSEAIQMVVQCRACKKCLA